MDSETDTDSDRHSDTDAQQTQNATAATDSASVLRRGGTCQQQTPPLHLPRFLAFDFAFAFHLTFFFFSRSSLCRAERKVVTLQDELFQFFHANPGQIFANLTRGGINSFLHTLCTASLCASALISPRARDILPAARSTPFCIRFVPRACGLGIDLAAR
eukprot:1971392-Rhodomonas_salina.1